jgi:hypothetical protein
MAKRNSTSRIRRGRKADSRTGTKRARKPGPAERADRSALQPSPSEDFGGERATLLKAQAVLACLSVSLNYYGWSGDDGTTYAMAADVARELVQEGMDRLEQRDRKTEAGRRKPN